MAPRASELTQELLFLYRGGAPVKERASIEELLKKSFPSLSAGANVVSLHRPDTKVKFEIGGRMWLVDVDKGQMVVVLRSLIGCGIQSMHFGGTLTIKAENIHIDRTIRGVPLPPGNFVKVMIVDQGKGIAEELLDRVFDPYFTSYQSTNGLQLTTAFSIVKHHGGTITVSSRPGKGTRVALFFITRLIRFW